MCVNSYILFFFSLFWLLLVYVFEIELSGGERGSESMSDEMVCGVLQIRWRVALASIVVVCVECAPETLLELCVCGGVVDNLHMRCVSHITIYYVCTILYDVFVVGGDRAHSTIYTNFQPSTGCHQKFFPLFIFFFYSASGFFLNYMPIYACTTAYGSDYYRYPVWHIYVYIQSAQANDASLIDGGQLQSERKQHHRAYG